MCTCQALATLAVGTLCLTTAATHAGDLWLPSVFSENLVLQRDMPAPVWGRAARGATVEATIFDGGKVLTKKTGTADATTGRWRVDLDPLPAGGRYSLLVQAKGKDNQVTEMRLLSNVLAGEVWLACGQSNLIWPMDADTKRDQAVREMGQYPNSRPSLRFWASRLTKSTCRFRLSSHGWPIGFSGPALATAATNSRLGRSRGPTGVQGSASAGVAATAGPPPAR